MDQRISVEPVVEHEYRVRVDGNGEQGESEFIIDPGVLDEFGLGAADERRVVEFTASFLIAHQPIIDLPQLVYLDEVAAAYDDYLPELRRSLG